MSNLKYTCKIIKNNQTLTLKIQAESKESAEQMLTNKYRPDSIKSIEEKSTFVSGSITDSNNYMVRNAYPYIKNSRGKAIRIYT